MSSHLPTFRRDLVFVFLVGLALILYSASVACPIQEILESSRPTEGKSQDTAGERVGYRLAEYSIQARIPIIGDIGHVGSFFIEDEICRTSDDLERFFRIFGRSKPELAEKGKDYSGELKSVKRLRLDGADDVGRWQNEGWPEAETSSSGHFKKNGIIEGENIIFYPDHAVSRRENGDEKHIEGSFGSLLSALRYFLDHEVRAGDVYESAFILGGHPYIFRCEVEPPTLHEPTRARVFPIDFTTYDGLEKDSRGRPKVSKKKGGIRVWLSKEGPYKNIYLRLFVQYRWYLSLQMEYLKAS
jgi:hypothetical protein